MAFNNCDINCAPIFIAGPRGMMDPRGMDPRMMSMMGGPGGPMGGPGGPCGGPPTSIQAQLEWQKMQQQFMQEKNKSGMMGPGKIKDILCIIRTDNSYARVLISGDT